MVQQLTGDELAFLRPGDRITYFGVRWQVRDYSTYTDAKGYEIKEWLIQSTTGKSYYLLRERDPAHSSASLHWYIAEAVLNPILYDPNTQTDVLTQVADRMRSQGNPYPVLQLFNRKYQFESQTKGTYSSENSLSERITWDYWDDAHLWNLALETWENGKLFIYSTREVQPEQFSELRPGEDEHPFSSATSALSSATQQKIGISRQNQLFMAWGLLIVGFFLMMAGI